MEYTVNYTNSSPGSTDIVNGLSDAYSVTLGSSDGTYGIKASSGAVVVPYNTSVQHPSPGFYQYTFPVSTGTAYTVSWQIVQSPGGPTTYSTEVVGPFSNTDIVNTSPEYTGPFSIGSFSSIYLKLFNQDGTPVDPDVISFRISNAATGTEVLTGIPEKYKGGYYFYGWVIPNILIGKYNIYWEFEINGTVHTQVYPLEVANVNPIINLSERFISLRIAVENLIAPMQYIGIFHEQARPSSDNQTYHFTFNNWNQSGVSPPIIYRNDTPIYSGYEINFKKGTVAFYLPNLPEDVIHADYNFRFFDDDKLRLFIENGLQVFNIYPPVSQWSTYNVPNAYVTPVIYEAAAQAIQIFRLSVGWPQYRSLFESKDQADKIYDGLDADLKAYREKSKELCEAKKLGIYAGLTSVVIQPWYTLPGGRARFFRYMFGSFY